MKTLAQEYGLHAGHNPKTGHAQIVDRHGFIFQEAYCYSSPAILQAETDDSYYLVFGDAWKGMLPINVLMICRVIELGHLEDEAVRDERCAQVARDFIHWVEGGSLTGSDRTMFIERFKAALR